VLHTFCSTISTGKKGKTEVEAFWFLVCYAATQLATPLHQKRIQVVRSNKVARKRLIELTSTPGLKMGKESKKNPEQIWPYLFAILFDSFPN